MEMAGFASLQGRCSPRHRPLAGMRLLTQPKVLERYTTKADVFSLAMVLYEIVGASALWGECFKKPQGPVLHCAQHLKERSCFGNQAWPMWN